MASKRKLEKGASLLGLSYDDSDDESNSSKRHSGGGGGGGALLGLAYGSDDDDEHHGKKKARATPAASPAVASAAPPAIPPPTAAIPAAAVAPAVPAATTSSSSSSSSLPQPSLPAPAAQAFPAPSTQLLTTSIHTAHGEVHDDVVVVPDSYVASEQVTAMGLLPPEPVRGAVDRDVQEKIRVYLSKRAQGMLFATQLKRSAQDMPLFVGLYFNASLQARKDFHNPSILDKIAKSYEIDPYGMRLFPLFLGLFGVAHSSCVVGQLPTTLNTCTIRTISTRLTITTHFTPNNTASKPRPPPPPRPRPQPRLRLRLVLVRSSLRSPARSCPPPITTSLRWKVRAVSDRE
jgi:hypothetical protein